MSLMHKRRCFLHNVLLLLAASVSLACTAETVTVRGDSLAPLVNAGQELSALPPGCATIERGDLVAFKTSAHTQASVIKRVEGLPGDKLAVKENGTVDVNGAPALAADGKPYIATAQGQRMIGLYAGTIPANAYLVLGNPGALDSSRIGLIPATEITFIVKAASLRGK
jgi:signal peptidase I